jgi:hypothetical protein
LATVDHYINYLDEVFKKHEGIIENICRQNERRIAKKREAEVCSFSFLRLFFNLTLRQAKREEAEKAVRAAQEAAAEKAAAMKEVLLQSLVRASGGGGAYFKEPGGGEGRGGGGEAEEKGREEGAGENQAEQANESA